MDQMHHCLTDEKIAVSQALSGIWNSVNDLQVAMLRMTPCSTVHVEAKPHVAGIRQLLDIVGIPLICCFAVCFSDCTI